MSGSSRRQRAAGGATIRSGKRLATGCASVCPSSVNHAWPMSGTGKPARRLPCAAASALRCPHDSIEIGRSSTRTGGPHASQFRFEIVGIHVAGWTELERSFPISSVLDIHHRLFGAAKRQQLTRILLVQIARAFARGAATPLDQVRATAAHTVITQAPSSRMLARPFNTLSTSTASSNLMPTCSSSHHMTMP